MIEKVTVFGGSGFIGSHVADTLESKGFKVVIFDNKDSTWANENQQVIVGDILDIEAVDEAVKDSKYVYNFAAMSDLNVAIDKPLECAQINIIGNMNILESCRKHKIERFIYASTIYVNSRQGGFYKCSKIASEEFIEEYQKTYGLDFTILRYGSLYGPRSDLSNGMHRIIHSALEKNILSYIGDIEAMREYINVYDAALASVMILDDKYINETLTLTGQEPMKVLDVLQMIAEILGLSSDSIEFIEKRYPGHYTRTPYAYKPKISRKFIPQNHIDLGQGIVNLISFLKNDR